MSIARSQMELVESLERLAHESELIAARHGELIREGHRIDDDVLNALRASSYFGFANGLRSAAALIVEGEGEGEGSGGASGYGDGDSGG